MTAKVLFAGGGTGGHVFPLVAVAEALAAIAPRVVPVFVGTERGLETRVIPERGFELDLVRVDPIRGRGFVGALRGVARAAMSLPEARALVRRHEPKAVLSIGGYAAGPVTLAARTMGLPVALIEPNAVMGLTNRLVASVVHRGYTAFEEVEAHFRSGRTLRAGVPIRLGFDPQPWSFDASAPRVLVLGGSQGARALNEIVPLALGRLSTTIHVVHQAGRGRADEVRAAYGDDARDRVSIVEFIDDVPAAIGAADLVVGRAGASAVSEICAVGRPSVLVPYPYASGGHQLANARAVERDGAGVCIDESEASPERIATEIEALFGDARALGDMAARAEARGRPDAAETIARDLLALAGLEPTAESTRASRAGHGPVGGTLALAESR